MDKPKVYVEKISDLDENMVYIVESLSKYNNQSVEKIAIKLNLCDFRTADTGAVSDPVVVESLLKALLKRYPSASISLVENDATSVRADPMFKFLGFDKLAEKYGAETVNLANQKWRRKEIDGRHFKTLRVPVLLDECDLFITHPKLKTHSLTKITCSLKNNYGCYRRKRKVRYHKYIDDAIVDINLALTTHMSIVDANICHEGVQGPSYGYPRKWGLLIGGDDLVAVDTFCARLAGFNPRFIGHIRKASSKGIGKMSYETVKKPELDLSEYKLDFSRVMYNLLRIFRVRTTY